MANKNKHVNFDIPVPIIVMAFIFCWPVGIVLTILRSLSIPENSKNSRTEEAKTYEREKNRSGNCRKKSSKAKNVSSGTKVTRFFAIFLGILGMITALSFAGSSASFTAFLRDFMSGACPLLLGAACCGIASKILGNRDTRFGRIRAIIGNRESINLTRLSTASKETLKSVRKDVQKMIDNGEFGEYAYIDLGTNNFMRSPYAEPDEPEQFDFRKVYGDVLKKEKKPETEEVGNVSQENTAKEADKDDFARILSEIRRLNDEIADETVSERIYRIEERTRNIFDYVTEHPEAMPQIRTFMNYYLPTTLKLLESYSRIERVGVAGENMKSSKEKIENILDLLVIGFEQQVDQLFRNESIDISSDISVLEKMMQKDGLNGKNDFDVSKFNEYSDDISDVFGGAAAQSAPDSDA